MNELERIKEMLCEELYKYGKKGAISNADLEIINKLAQAIKNLGKIEMMDEEGESYRGYSRDGNWMARGVYGRDESYAHDESYARRKRDRMGRYSRESYEGNMGGGYSQRRYSRDGAKGYMMEQLEEMMEEAESPKEREALKRCMESLKNG